MPLKLSQKSDSSAAEAKAEARSGLIGSKIANKITNISKNLPENKWETLKMETLISKERYISPEKDKKLLTI